MKKIAILSLTMCLILLLQCTVIPVLATEATESTVTPTDVGGETATEATKSSSSLPFGSVCIQNGCRTIEGMVPLAGSGRMLESAQAAFAYETTTNTVLYAYNPDMKVSPGTQTKILLALLVIENCELDEVVTCSSGIQSKIPAGSSNVNLKSEEQLTVEALLHCLLLQSANDAAVALAEHIAGTTDNCVAMLNKRAAQLGCTSTEFGNISGLDTATSYTTARDMAKIVVEASQNETFMSIYSATEYQVPATNKMDERATFYTLNYLRDQHNIQQFYDKRVTGGYASYSDQSGASLTCTASYNNLNVVCVTLGSMRTYMDNGWKVKSYGNFNEMLDLLNYIFENFKVNRVLYDGQALAQFTVADGECNVVGGPKVDLDTVLFKNSQMTNLTMYYNVTGGGLTAPVQKGDMISTVQVWYRDSCLLEAELYALGNVKSLSNSNVSIHSKDTSSGFSGVLNVLGTVCVVILGLAGAYIGYNYLRIQSRKAKRRRRRQNRRRSR